MKTNVWLWCSSLLLAACPSDPPATPDATVGYDAGDRDAGIDADLPGTDAATDAGAPDATVVHDGGSDGGIDASDPCAGLEPCAAEGMRCSGPDILVCMTNADGCLVATRRSCAAEGAICDDDGPSPECVPDACFAVPEDARCDTPSAMCVDGTAIRCEPNEAGCLVRTEVPCGPDARCHDGACLARCANEDPIVIDCDSVRVETTTESSVSALDDYRPCLASGDYRSPDRMLRFVNRAERREVELRLIALDHPSYPILDLFVFDGGDGTSCPEPGTCRLASHGLTRADLATFIAPPDSTFNVVVDGRAEGFVDGPFAIEVECRPAVCGDGIITVEEGCDDANTTDGDGCSATCTIEPYFQCVDEPSECASWCGNGVVDAADLRHPVGERCDDGNHVAGDGCSPTCEIEQGYGCNGNPSSCILRCGNGLTGVGHVEMCDDRRRVSGDGCSSTCEIEAGYYCEGEPSVCEAVTCGDSIVGPGESCDPPGPSCSSRCAIALPPKGFSAFIEGALTSTDPVYSRTNERGVSYSTPDDFHYDTWVLENRESVPRTVVITAWWSGSGTSENGFLFAYDFPFNPTVERFHWLRGADDSPGTTRRTTLYQPVAPGQRVVIVATTSPPRSTIGHYQLELVTID